MSDTFHSRLVDEKAGLSEKLDKLNRFIGTDAFVKLSVANQVLLLDQAEAMGQYDRILAIRLELLK